MALGTDWDQGHTSLSKPFTAIGLKPAAPPSSVIPLELCPVGTLHPFPSFLGAGESLGPESSGEQGGRAERLPGAWREEGQGEGKVGRSGERGGSAVSFLPGSCSSCCHCSAR